MYRFCLRAVQVTRILVVEDLDVARGRIRIPRAKGGEPKEYPMPRDLVKPLKRYLRKRPERGPFLFTGRQSNNQRGITVLRVQQLFKRYAAAGLPSSVPSHSVRHSIAVHSLEEDYGLEPGPLLVLDHDRRHAVVDLHLERIRRRRDDREP
jgi:integrase